MRKLRRLEMILKRMGSVLVAFSAGVDSTFLAAVAQKTLGNAATAVTVSSPFVPANEIKKAIAISRAINISHFVLRFKPPAGCWKNGRDRCYVCKKALFSRICAEANRRGIKYVLDGSNLDDINGLRPGARALTELKVVSPLQTAGFTKMDIRCASRRMGLETWNMEPSPCLATRLAYGCRITLRALSMIERAEEYVRGMGLSSVRVRFDGHACRIEVSEKQIPVLIKKRKGIVRRLTELGFTYVTADLSGYRSGAMNEVLTWTKKRS